jgi:Arc/MetJ-type ribon-helix-helix transcriptional regulator
MPLTLTLYPHGEELIAAHLRSGRYHSPEEVVNRALETLAEKETPVIARKRTPAEVVAHYAGVPQGYHAWWPED